jgi:hypothetical protein
MLTYATLDDFKIAKQIKEIKPPHIAADKLQYADDKIIDYLVRATRFINRFTRREFFPWRETRKFAVPHRYLDLSMRRFTQADLYFDHDLLKVNTLTNGNGDVLVEDTDFFLMESNMWPKNAVQLKFPNFWGGGYNLSILSRSFDEPVIIVDGIWGYHDLFGRQDEAWVDTFDTVHVDGIDATTKFLKVGDFDDKDSMNMTKYNIGNLLKIDDEYMEIIDTKLGTDPDTDPNTVKVLRGVRGTTAAAHTDPDSKIYKWRVVDDITEACYQIAKTWRESDTSAGGRLGVSDYSAGVEIGIPADPLNTIKMYQRSMIAINN